MAFNFNWSPLSTDAGFLPRAQELLTNALNRADPKPAIIVDDIIVNELNLGDVPPELEILEIGDLAEDRFRGTFKIMYKGNAYLTLKTKVQANPLNTYVRTRSAFASPQPLAADTGLTIPLQITLSEFRLSGFIILVFSRQKGLTLVFRNDPLESMRVSSTFDSIPFVANFLQKEIENTLRGLLMDELPAIIHRLSLQLLVPEYKANEEREVGSAATAKAEVVVDPLASPPQDPVDSTGNALTPAEVAALSLDSSLETLSLFSRKNLIRLATLTDSHRTLSLFTPPIRDAVFRAWTGPLERGEMSATGTHSRLQTPALSRTHSYAGSLSTATTFSLDGSSNTRPSLHSYHSSTYGVSMGTSRHGQGHRPRRRKKRVVDLRAHPETGKPESVTDDGSTADTASVSESTSATTPSVFSAPAATMSSDPSRSVDATSPRSLFMPKRGDTLQDLQARANDVRSVSEGAPGPSTLRRSEEAANTVDEPRLQDPNATIRARNRRSIPMTFNEDDTPRQSMYLPEQPEHTFAESTNQPFNHSSEKAGRSRPTLPALPSFTQFVTDPNNASGIAERAWMAKMASEMTRRYEEERTKGSFGPMFHRDDERPPPPAYAQ
ncbi:ERMES complex subunit [Elasticomyces elasticus]|uniref:Mitochondrial distribution and morphology protein 34 n=1 Tax=Exophiala sideris TaxID=1016849 RepID=A0ABR0J3R9_9EURO|nr:ERMES complex subunit [Elasticomyces elasticus]KAK5026494.1 ERMES complex subunit [Exophiala sideris]KAK5033765.1 ERMES complex subunit [Exophiala sideris]KAK5055587.1 ERMES complex subunit [Exophiala sideris]KAK5180029.1 ERMES complex subunit [Eurotiomycetes sp. CCFEE 6388]